MRSGRDIPPAPSWRWIPTIIIANFAGSVGAVVFGLAFFPLLSLLRVEVSLNVAALAMSVGYGVVFGYVTSIPMASMLAPNTASATPEATPSETLLD